MKAILFDLDGTLIDSLADIATSVNRMLAEHGLPLQPTEVFPRYIGDGVRILVERVLPAEILATADIGALVDAYQRHYSAAWNDQTRPYEGFPAVLHTLHARGLMLGVLSNKPQAFTRLCCDHFFPDVPFAAVLGARDGVPRKPDPTAALDLLRQWGIAPPDSVYVGDSGLDMEMATRAGMLPVGVRWGFRGEDELLAAGAKQVISAPADLLSCID